MAAIVWVVVGTVALIFVLAGVSVFFKDSKNTPNI